MFFEAPGKRRSIALIAFLMGSQAIVMGAEPTETIESLKKQIETLTARVQALEQQEAKTAQQPRIAESTNVAPTGLERRAVRLENMPTVSLGANGLMVQSADSNFTASIHGYIQVDGRFYPWDSGSTSDTFLLRRVRPIFEGTVYKYFDYRLMLDFGSGNAVPGSSAGNNALLDDAYLNVHPWEPLQAQVGKFKSPVGLERLESTADLMFVETGFATQLTPNYDLGVELHNSLFKKPLNYAIGVFNGAPDAGSTDQDVNESGKDIAGRLFAQPFINSKIPALSKLGFGVGGSYGDHRGAVPGYRTAGQQTFFSYSNNVTASGQQYRIDPQMYYFWGPFGIQGEWILSSQKLRSSTPGAGQQRFDNTAWQVQASYFITGEENTFKPTSLIRVTPLNPLSLSGGGWGAFEVVGRVQQLSLDQGAFPEFAVRNSARRATAWGAGLNWYLNRNVKVSLDYERTSFDGGNPRAGTVSSEDENFIVTQLQFAF